MLNRRRLWRRLFYWLLLLVFFLFTVGNIALNSSWTKSYVTGVLGQKTGEVWEIGTITLTPDGVLHIYAIESQLGDGKILVKHVAVRPNYAMALKKQIRFSEVLVEQPEITLTDAWIIEKLGTKIQDLVEEPVLAALESKASTNGQGSGGVAVEPVELSAAASPEVERVKPTAGVKKVEGKPNQSSAPVGNNGPENFYESWLRVRDAQFRIVNKHGEVHVVDGVDADLPVGGHDLTGELAWDGVSVFDRELNNSGTIKIEKKGPVLSVKETVVDFFGIKLRPDIYVGHGSQGLVFYIDLLIPEQRVEKLFMHLDLTVDLSVDNITGRVQLTGLMNHPSTWRGIADVRALDVRAVEGHRGTTAHFDSLLFQSYVHGGVVQFPSIELRGEDITLMSNGVLRMNGEGYGIVRLVMLPEKKAWVDRLTSGSGFFDGVSGVATQPFETEDLHYMDVKLDGSILSPMMMLDRKSDWQPLWPAIIRLQSFIKEERLEEIL